MFEDWNKGVLDSYLIEITGEILGVKDEEGGPLVEKILDAAGQKALASGPASPRSTWAYR